jgi:hypothetical protein
MPLLDAGLEWLERLGLPLVVAFACGVLAVQFTAESAHRAEVRSLIDEMHEASLRADRAERGLMACHRQHGPWEGLEGLDEARAVPPAAERVHGALQ